MQASKGIIGPVVHTTGSGKYELTLNRNADGCAVVASVDSSRGVYDGGVAQVSLAGTKLDVATQVFNSSTTPPDFGFYDDDFYVAVFC